MKTKAVKSIPEIQYFDSKERERNEIIKMLTRFEKMKSKYIQVLYDEDEYAAVSNLTRAIRDGIKNGGFDMKVHRRGSAVYVEKL